MQEGLRKVGDTEALKALISPSFRLSVRRQSELLGINRSSLYYVPVGESTENLELMRKLDQEYLEHPTNGVLGMVRFLVGLGFIVGPKRVRRLLRKMNLMAIYPQRNLSKPGRNRYIYSYRLRGLEIERSNQVWCIDITYIPMEKGFMYLTAIIDVYSRYIVGWGLSNTLDSTNSLDVFKRAISEYGQPTIINSDQGSQFTCQKWVDYLEDEEIEISMDGRGRALDNVWIERFWRTLKREYVYLQPADNVNALREGLKKYIHYYNNSRGHSSLDDYKPSDFYEYVA